ncbi:hypothetical protein V9T40_003554 [Parthenolecanium corni]|uniref:Enoyl reductase (ER) domain-containing protein n=1 Tax=Parthenolecanium corni TaxID=536013 RepID=A0AAN9TQX5_9HEMI
MATITSKTIFIQKLISNFAGPTPLKRVESLINAVSVRRFADKKVSSIKSAVIKEFNQPLIIETSENSVPLKKGQVRIGVHCCAVNVADHLLWTGLSETKPKLPFVAGFEISGEILEVAPKAEHSADSESEDEDELRVGDRVLALNKVHLGGFSSECIVDYKDVFPIPPSINYKTAAALADSYGTAMLGLARRARVQQNEVVLITAAAGGLGLAAVDIAANVYKTKVIGICGTEDKSTLVREKGAWTAFSFRNDKIVKGEVDKISEGKGVDVVFEAVGGEVFKSALECVRAEGKVIVAGFTSRDMTQLTLADIIQLPSFSLIGVSLFNYRNKMLPVYRRTILDVIDLCDQGMISPVIAEVFPLDNVNDALHSISQKKTTGKVILEIVPF